MTKASSRNYLVVMADGTHADPAGLKADDDGVLRNESGVACATREDGTPLTVEVAAQEGGNVAAASGVTDPTEATEISEGATEKAGEAEPVEARKTRPAPKAKTR